MVAIATMSGCRRVLLPVETDPAAALVGAGDQAVDALPALYERDPRASAEVLVNQPVKAAEAEHLRVDPRCQSVRAAPSEGHRVGVGRRVDAWARIDDRHPPVAGASDRVGPGLDDLGAARC